VYSVRSHQSHYDDPDVDRFRHADFDPESFDEPAREAARQRDSFIDLAKWDLKSLFAQEPETVFYQRQLQVMFERVLSLDYRACPSGISTTDSLP